MRKDRRFVVIERERSYLSDQGLQMILADRKTGVSYLYVKSGYGADECTVCLCGIYAVYISVRICCGGSSDDRTGSVFSESR